MKSTEQFERAAVADKNVPLSAIGPDDPADGSGECVRRGHNPVRIGADVIAAGRSQLSHADHKRLVNLV